jgi:hypothetical protein
MPDDTEPSSPLPAREPDSSFPIPPTPSRPSDVPSDEDRQAVVLTIQQALAEDLVAFDDVDERFAGAYAADTQAELRAVVADLPDLRRPPPRPGVRHIAPASSVKLLGDTKISGWLSVDDDISVVTLIGDVLVDLSTAEMPSDGVTITTVGLIGDVKVILPDGVQVQAQSSALIGDTKKDLSPPLANRPTVRVKGFQAIGDVSVYSLSRVPVGALRKLWAKLRGGSTSS